MAKIRDLKQRLETQEGESGEALIKTLKKALDEVYVDARGWQKFVGTQNKGVVTKDTDRLWEEAYKEILSESKTAVKAKKSDKAKEILGDLVSLTKDIAATEGVNVSIASGIQAMIEAVQPSIQQRIKTLKKGEGIFKSMKKKAVSSAAGAVESFASGLLAPLPFGAGEAIIGKAKGVFGGGKKERRGEQAMAFASRLQEEEIETSGEKGGAKSAGGKVAKTLMGNGEEEGGIVSEKNLEETNDILRDILIAVTPDREALEEAKRKKEMLRQEGKGGKIKFGDKGWMKSMMGGIMAGAMVVGAIAAAVGALVMMVFDGIEGYFLAEEWGVSKMNAVIGAVIGGTGKGLTGAMWGGVKGGAAGFAIGMLVGGPLGAIIGGAVGMLIGGIAGWFGGERIANLLEELTSWFEKKWKALRVGLGLDAYSDADIERIKKERVKLAEAEVKRQEDYFKKHGEEVAAEAGITKETIKKAKIKHEKISKATVKGIRRGDDADIVEGAEGAAIVSAEKGRQVTETLSSVLPPQLAAPAGEMVRGGLYQLDEFSRLLSSLDPTSGNFLGTGLGTYNALPDWAKPYFSKHGIIGGAATELFSASLSNMWSGDRQQAKRKLDQWNAEANVEPQQQLEQKSVKEIFPQYSLDLIARGTTPETHPQFFTEKEREHWKVNKGLARGGIVTKPLYLPSSGIVVGEHPSFSGRGAYAGGLTRGIPDRQNNTGMEAIIPLDQRGIEVMRKATGADLNEAAMVTALRRGGPGGGGFVNNNVVDNSVINNNNTAIIPTNARGKRLPDEERIFG